jgi:hypothetical protein
MEGELVCDLCGLSVPVDAFPAHCTLCRSVIRSLNWGFSIRDPPLFGSQNFFANMLFDSDYSSTSSLEEEMFSHKIVRRLKDVDRVAPKREFSDDVCCVCMESMSNNVRRTSCNHEFCSQCIETWFGQNTTCPVCKQDFADDAGYELIDTQTMQPVNEQNSGSEEPSASNPVVRSIMRRLDIIGSILNEVEQF